MSNQVYFAWISYQRRADTMQSFFGYSMHHLPAPFKSTLLKPFGYFIQFYRMLKIIKAERAEVVWIQLPPTFLLHLLHVGKLVTGQNYKIVADCHNGALRKPWVNFPMTLSMLNRCEIILTHNEEINCTASQIGVDSSRQVVLEDPPAEVYNHRSVEPFERPSILVPCSFGSDEPINELIEAARFAPEIHFYITGNLSKAKAKGFLSDYPSNITWTGFLSSEDYEDLLFSVTAILGLTTVEGIQLSVASEAIGAGKAMILSDTAILRKMFSKAAIFTSHNPSDLAKNCREAIENSKELDDRSRELRDARIQKWKSDANNLKGLL